ncbi:hypothetical protein GGI07_004311 [Coemansia sp. Benny D115]|nr:hypothetical protein GGI07_004311 [Coemansia sp. Benny D115]
MLTNCTTCRYLLPRLSLQPSVPLHTSAAIHAQLRRNFKGSYHWSTQEDEQIKSLVAKHGKAWIKIRRLMDIDTEPGNIRIRYSVLTSSRNGLWTEVEDRTLCEIIGDLKTQGMAPGSYYGFWVLVSEKLATGRTPRDCQKRWSYIDVDVNRHTWSQDERAKIQSAVDLLSHLSNLPEDVAHARSSEPWLLITDNGQSSRLPKGFWHQVSKAVGSRSPHQCMMEWISRHEICLGQPKYTSSFEEAKRLAQLIEQHGRKWEYIHRNFMPHITPHNLFLMYSEWLRAIEDFGPNVFDVDPSDRLVDYKGGTTALRPTGSDGLYDPSGPVRKVYIRHPKIALTSVYLAFLRADASGRLRLPRKSNKTSTKRGFAIPQLSDKRAYNRVGRLAGTAEKLVESIIRRNGDMKAVSKDMKAPRSECIRAAKAVSQVIPSAGQMIDAMSKK